MAEVQGRASLRNEVPGRISVWVRVLVRVSERVEV